MTPAQPTFFRLFQQSRHCNAPAPDDDSSDAKKRKQQRERFAAAALAFCLKHDPAFRQYFWEKVCRVRDDDPQMPPIADDGIGLEPPRWADLSLSSKASGSRTVWVVEVKAGADLQDIQNPSHKLFGERDGYGALFAQDENDPKTRRRYIVFGHEEPLALPEKDDRLGIWFQQRSWSDIESCPGTTLVTDLLHCLGLLGIQPFAMNKAKSFAVVKGLAGAGAAHDVLMAIYTSLGIKGSRQQHFEVYPEEDGSSVAGIYVKRPATKPSSAHLQLKKLTGSSDIIAWVGYFADPDDKITRAVQFYCGRAEKRDSLLTILQKRFPSAEPQEEGTTSCVFIESSATDGIKDLEWFQSVFRAAGVGGMI
jgi:hypothetical protein